MNLFFDSSPLSTGHKGRGIGAYTKNLKQALKKYTDINISQKFNKDTDITHYPFFDFFFHTLPLFKKTKTVVTIHDTIPLIFPKYYQPGTKGRLKFLLQKLALKNVDAIITDSNSSKNDIHKYLKFPAKKIYKVSLSVPQDFKKASDQLKISKSKKYLLYVGDINYNKNLPRLIRAFSNIKNQKVSLYIVSRALKNKNIKQSKQIHRAIKENNLKSRVRIYDKADTKKVARLYKNASWYIQPSLYEGFGLPILEAFYSGKPVISSKTSSLPEVAGKSVLYFDPYKTFSITKTIDKALSMSDPQIEKLKSENKKQLKKFSWKKTAQQTEKVYKKVLGLN